MFSLKDEKVAEPLEVTKDMFQYVEWLGLNMLISSLQNIMNTISVPTY